MINQLIGTWKSDKVAMMGSLFPVELADLRMSYTFNADGTCCIEEVYNDGGEVAVDGHYTFDEDNLQIVLTDGEGNIMTIKLHSFNANEFVVEAIESPEIENEDGNDSAENTIKVYFKRV